MNIISAVSNYRMSSVGNILVDILESAQFETDMLKYVNSSSKNNKYLCNQPLFENFLCEEFITLNYPTIRYWSIIVFGSLLSLITSFGNILVLASFQIDKHLRIVNNYFLFSLAVADLIIGLISIPFMTMYTAVDYWPLGYKLCQFWLSVDYCMSNASVYNLLLISLDRYFSLTRPLTYRPMRTFHKAMTMILSTYITSTVLWPPIIILWPYLEGQFVVASTECVVQFLKTNPYITVTTALLAFYIPVTVMLILYTKIYALSQGRHKQISKLQEVIHEHGRKQSSIFLRIPPLSVTTDDTADVESESESETVTGSIQPDPISNTEAETLIMSRCMSRDLWPVERLTTSFGSYGSIPRPSMESISTRRQSYMPSGKAPPRSRLTPTTASKRLSQSMKIPRSHKVSKIIRHQKAYSLRPGTRGCMEVPESQKSSNTLSLVPLLGKIRSSLNRSTKKLKAEKHQENKAAKTLSAILLAFIVTWAPYNIIVCWEAFRPNSVSGVWFTLSYYLCYINSTVNPICYALCNMSFRRAFYRILTGKWSKKYARNTLVRK